jgi:hypothetical protein
MVRSQPAIPPTELRCGRFRGRVGLRSGGTAVGRNCGQRVKRGPPVKSRSGVSPRSSTEAYGSDVRVVVALAHISNRTSPDFWRKRFWEKSYHRAKSLCQKPAFLALLLYRVRRIDAVVYSHAACSRISYHSVDTCRPYRTIF